MITNISTPAIYRNAAVSVHVDNAMGYALGMGKNQLIHQNNIGIWSIYSDIE